MKNQYIAGDIPYRIKIYRQTTWRLYPQFADSMSPPPWRNICTIRYVFLLKYIASWKARINVGRRGKEEVKRGEGVGENGGEDR